MIAGVIIIWQLKRAKMDKVSSDDRFLNEAIQVSPLQLSDDVRRQKVMFEKHFFLHNNL